VQHSTLFLVLEVTISLEPDVDTAVSLLADQVLLLGHDTINLLLLLDYGIGSAGVDDDAVFLADVCPEPSVLTERRLLRTSRGYVWKAQPRLRLKRRRRLSRVFRGQYRLWQKRPSTHSSYGAFSRELV
jgi:hypothetical protein